jgi:hypothetical protein
MPTALKRNPATTLLMIITALTAWIALGLQQYIIIDRTPGNGLTPIQAVWRFLLFFTILSNLLVAISLTTILIKPTSSAGRFFEKPATIAAITLYIFIVGLVYNLVLRNIWNPTGRDKVADELLHVAVPLLYTIYFLFFAPKEWLPWKTLLPWLIYPAVYLIYAMIRGVLENFYVYPFLDLNVLSTSKVIFNCSMVLIAFVVVGLLFIGYCRFIKKAKS